MPTPARARTMVTIGIARSPIVTTCAAATIPPNSTASMRLRATRSAPIVVCALARRMPRSDPQAVHGDVGRVQPGPDALVGLLDRDGEDAMVRAAEREEGAREVGAEPRGDADERRAPRKPPAFAQEHGLGRMRRVRPEPREDLEAAGERPRAAAERRPRTLVRHVVDAIRHET